MSDTPVAAVPETKPVSELTRIALAALEREYRRSLAVIGQAAAAVEGLDLNAGWRLDANTGTWVRAAADPPKAPTP